MDIGAIDDLAALADVCAAEKLWFHVDGAFGALGVLAPGARAACSPASSAPTSIAFDFHKWGQVPYDAGCILVRDAEPHRARPSPRPPPICGARRAAWPAARPGPATYGPDLSRGFRALKIWFTLKVYGTERLGAVIAQSCALARASRRPDRSRARAGTAGAGRAQHRLLPLSRRRAPIALNAAIVADLQEAGIAAPSTTVIDGRLAIRAALVNHRTQIADIDALVKSVLRVGRARSMAAA